MDNKIIFFKISNDCELTDKQIDNIENTLTQKIGKKVILIPAYFTDVILFGDDDGK